MTTTVHAYSSYVHDGKKLQIVRRYPSTGIETVLQDSLVGHNLETHHVWGDCELVFREVPIEAPVAAPDELTAKP